MKTTKALVNLVKSMPGRGKGKTMAVKGGIQNNLAEISKAIRIGPK